jgi:hypothetical protein
VAAFGQHITALSTPLIVIAFSVDLQVSVAAAAGEGTKNPIDRANETAAARVRKADEIKRFIAINIALNYKSEQFLVWF